MDNNNFEKCFLDQKRILGTKRENNERGKECMIRDESKYDKKSLEKSKKECVGGQNRRKVTKKDLDKMTDFENIMKNNGTLTRPAISLVKTFLKSTKASETYVHGVQIVANSFAHTPSVIECNRSVKRL